MARASSLRYGMEPGAATSPATSKTKWSSIAGQIEAGLEKGQQPRTPDELRGFPKEEVFEEYAQLERAFEVLQEQ